MDASSRLRDGEELQIVMHDLLRKRPLRMLDSSEVGELMKGFGLLAE
jgi:hypothetical protein